MKFKLVRVFVFIVVVTISFNAFTQSIEEDTASGRLPLPSDAKPLEAPSMNMPFKGEETSIYKTYLSKKDLIKFYAKELKKRGWQEQESLSKILKKNNISLDKRTMYGSTIDIQAVLQDVSHFHKGGEILTFMVMPARGTRQETLFSLAYIKKTMAPSAGLLPQELKELRDSIPDYPGAQFISSTGGVLSYQASADIEDVISFYKQKMFAYGWDLKREAPLKEEVMRMPIAFPEDGKLCEDCPSVEDVAPGFMEAMEKGMSNFTAKLQFGKDSGQKCKIDFTQFKNEIFPSPFTQINIRYYE